LTFKWYADGADSSAEENSSVIPSPNALVAVSKSMQAVKLCFSKIFQFLSGVPAVVAVKW